MLTWLAEAIVEQHADHPVVAHAGGAPDPATITAVQISHRWQGRAIFVLFRRRDRDPWLVVKADRDPRHRPRLHQEHDTLRALEPEAAFAGLVPVAVGMVEVPGAVALVQSAVPGTPLTAVLRRRGGFRRHAGERDHLRVLEWMERLRRWGSSTEDLGWDEIDLAQLPDELAAALPGDARRLGWVERIRSAASPGGLVRVPLVRGHGDLGPSNLLQRRSTLRLVDWESPVAARSPLPEALTFVAHYTRATPLPGGRMPTRRQAMRRTLLGRDGLGQLSRRTWHRVLADLRVDPEFADLLLVRTLVDLAAGRSGTAHRARGQGMWTDLLTHVAEQATKHPEDWPPP